MKRQSGFTLVELVVAFALIMVGSVVIYNFGGQNKTQLQKLNEQQVALTSVQELLELFRAHDSNQLNSYLSENPFKAGECPSCTNCASCPSCHSCQPYPLCAHINLLDRQNSTAATPIILNEDPLAATTDLTLTQANRFYSVQVVDATTLAKNSAACNVTASAYTLAANERYLVTVGLSWISAKDSSTPTPQRVVLSTVIP